MRQLDLPDRVQTIGNGGIKPMGTRISPWLADDWERALLLGRMDYGEGPLPVMLRDGQIEDLSAIAPTTVIITAT